MLSFFFRLKHAWLESCSLSFDYDGYIDIALLDGDRIKTYITKKKKKKKINTRAFSDRWVPL